MARTRTTKKLAQRIDLNYFKRSTPFKRAKLYLSILVPLIALIWITVHFVAKDKRVYSSGRLSAAHAVLEKECATCHLPQTNSYSAEAVNSACLSCHDGPAHHESALKQVAAKQLDCATCHMEHRGRVNISATTNQNCAQCHSDLRTFGGSAQYAANIRSFQDGHPEFAALRTGTGTGTGKIPNDPGTIKLNHHLHMQQIRRGPNGPLVQLDCADCHRPLVVKAKWNYSDKQYESAVPTYSENSPAIPTRIDTSAPPKPRTGREQMAPVKFATACASCHLLTYDKRFDDGVPHDKPEVVHAFLVKKFQDYIAAHPAELREMQDPSRMLSGKTPSPSMQTLSPTQWVSQHTLVAEELLWKKTCAQCHTVTGASLQETRIGRWSPSADNKQRRIINSTNSSATNPAISTSAFPEIVDAHAMDTWFPHAKFDHDAHRGFSCASCHQKALSSVESTDVLIPGISTCQTCHAPGPGYAESRCSECHTYHDWSQRKEITPHFTLPALKSSGN